jgi:tripartite-type tricarboxylate transporter receptor subunit TctC
MPAGAGRGHRRQQPREMDQTVRDEIARWKKLVQSAGITAD